MRESLFQLLMAAPVQAHAPNSPCDDGASGSFYDDVESVRNKVISIRDISSKVE